MSEHITLQFGPYSNHVGAHYWNSLQEVVDRVDDGEEYEELLTNKLFRGGSSYSNSKVSIARKPRTICFDYKGSFSHPDDQVVEDNDTIFNWNGSVDIIKENDHDNNSKGNINNDKDWLNSIMNAPVVGYDTFGSILGFSDEQHEQYNDDENKYTSKNNNNNNNNNNNKKNNENGNLEIENQRVNEVYDSWYKYMNTTLSHPSMQEYSVWETTVGVDNYFAGLNNQVVSSIEREDHFDAFRVLLEECDGIECINILSDAQDMSGGLTYQYLADIRDELRNTDVVIWMFASSYMSNKDSNTAKIRPTNRNEILHSISTSIALAQFSEFSNLIVPVCCDDTFLSTAMQNTFNPFTNKFQSSAVVASAIETALSCSYFKNSSDYLVGEYLRKVTNQGTFKVAGLETAIPLQECNMYLNKIDWSQDSITVNPYLRPLSPCYDLLSPNITSVHRERNNVFSNCISFRGSASLIIEESEENNTQKTKNMNELLSETCRHNPYLVTDARMSSTPLVMNHRYPYNFKIGTNAKTNFHGKIGDYNDEEEIITGSIEKESVCRLNDYQECRSSSALTCGTFIGKYLNSRSDEWSMYTSKEGNSGRSITTHLHQVGMDHDSINEVREMLLDLTHLHSE